MTTLVATVQGLLPILACAPSVPPGKGLQLRQAGSVIQRPVAVGAVPGAAVQEEALLGLPEGPLHRRREIPGIPGLLLRILNQATVIRRPSYLVYILIMVM